eukprot:TRINITY_DN8450_c0_g4_i2.p1 TRINITY_DN8450_c0_g4~~TRINITY_DN8450_c0_g4_i2.p1  ORF type:complete len:273 (+),score=63.96 TRINITY_DN8450_c0_g4_i2:48-821(+)
MCIRDRDNSRHQEHIEELDQPPVRESSERKTSVHELSEHRLSFRNDEHIQANNHMKAESIQDISILRDPTNHSTVIPEQRYRKFKSTNTSLPEDRRDPRKEIKVTFDNRIRLTKLIDPQSTIKEIISSLRSTLELKGYIYKNVKNTLLLKDENGYELDEEEVGEYYLLSRGEFKLEFRKHGPEYALAAEGSFELLDVPEKVIDMALENGEYKFRVAWKKRKNGVQPLPSYASEKAIMCHNPTFLFEFYAGFAKKIVK